ncbi:hypothetical protein N7517_007409 [Penicillium concentricum]|uniref:Uncharacterized protein n=1 Tax=Penicillium concentricum TaxID=293559 RepID=A0A9W9SFV7_9EURO|nr:uncharacterized protein N7517_007409 [Penicillium concentricum]KAJ5375403.1 hypothetical protein N7517_007409 [Penicillium concentricum]
MLLMTAKEHEYKPLSNANGDLDREEPQPHLAEPSKTQFTVPHMICFIVSLITAFTAGVLLILYISNTTTTHCYESGTVEDISIAPHLPLPQIAGKFKHKSPFTEEPPREGNASEPVWDALIPNGLGYFIPAATNTSKPKSSSVVIPSAFHQLHCLYLLRRAYYTPESELQRFDFGRNRSVHVAHCFDYLAQAITCSADSTLEPAVDKEHGFLGAGFARRCWDFEYLKSVVENRRAFNASGFLAWGAGKDGKVGLG